MKRFSHRTILPIFAAAALLILGGCTKYECFVELSTYEGVYSGEGKANSYPEAEDVAREDACRNHCRGKKVKWLKLGNCIAECRAGSDDYTWGAFDCGEKASIGYQHLIQ